MAGDDLTREAEQRLAAALERIADMADQGLSFPSAAPSAEPGPAPDVREVVARLDRLIDRLRAALGQHAPS